MGCRRRRRRSAAGRQGRRGKLIEALRWDLEWGAQAEWLADLAAESGTVPAALVQQPDLPDRLLFVWTAFQDLRDDRPLGFGVIGGIPWSALDRYGRRAGLIGDEFDRFVRLVKAMDAVWLEWAREKMKPKASG